MDESAADVVEWPWSTRFGTHRYLTRTLRWGRWLERHGHSRSARVVDLLNRVLFSADVPVRAAIPDDVVFMHNGLGTAVDEHVVFRGPALVFQHVTLGHAIGGRRRGCPTVGRHVIIGAGAVVVGGIEIGDGAIIAANSVVSEDVPPGARVRGNPARAAAQDRAS